MSIPAPLPLVALVDDDPSMLRASRRLLLTSGFAVHAFATAHDLLEACKSTRFDCLVVDVQMPSVNGFELAARLADEGLQVPILFMTAHDTDWVRKQVEVLGGRGLLVKPFRPRLLLEHLAAIPCPSARASCPAPSSLDNA